MGSMYKVYTIDNVTVTDGHITNADVSMDISQIGFRLPTEAEWELAARGGNPNSGYWGYYYSGGNNKDNVANTSNPLLPIRRKLDNFIGLYDMSGNADEWCWDYGPDPTIFNNGRRLRGGSWEETANYMKITDRNSYYAGGSWSGKDTYGFRIVRNIE